MPKLTFKSRSVAVRGVPVGTTSSGSSSESTSPGKGSRVETATVLSPRGFIDSASYRFFERALEGAHRQKSRFLILDFSGVHYINSTGISAVIRYFGLYRERGGLLVLVAVPKPVGLSMHLLGVTSLIPFHRDAQAAVEQFQQVLDGTYEESQEAGRVARESEKRKVYVPLRRGKSPLKDSSLVLLMPRACRFSRVLSLRYASMNGQLRIFHDTGEAIKAINQRTPDLVLLDERMDRSGDFVTQLKVHPDRSLTSVIKIYEKDSPPPEEELDFKIWENDYLVDPFEVLELFSLAEAELTRVPRDRKVFQQQVRVQFRTTRPNVEKACKVADLIIRRCLDSEEDRTALYAAVKEGIDNATVHGNKWNEKLTIDLNFLVDRDKVTVLIEDEGEGFDYEYYLSKIDDREAFERARQKIMKEGRRGGLGILLMSRCTDRIHYSGRGNALRLEKNLS